MWHAHINFHIHFQHFQFGPLCLKLIGGPHFLTQPILVDILFHVNVKQHNSSQAVSVNLRVSQNTYLLKSIFKSLSCHQILPPSFTFFHLSLHWLCVWVWSICSNTAFQNLGVLADILLAWLDPSNWPPLQSINLCNHQQSVNQILMVCGA